MEEYCIAGNFQGRKLISQFCGYLRKFSPRHLEAWHPLVQQKGAIRASFLQENRIFHQFAKVFSIESFPLYITWPSHPYHMIITWPSHDHHMLITCSSHDHHMIITWSSHADHMTITWSSHDHHRWDMECRKFPAIRYVILLKDKWLYVAGEQYWGEYANIGSTSWLLQWGQYRQQNLHGQTSYVNFASKF